MDTIANTIKLELEAVRPGEVIQRQHGTAGFPPPFPGHFTARSTGKGLIQHCLLYPGIGISFYTLLADSASFSHDPNGAALEVSYCHLGRAGWDMKQGHTIYLGSGDYSIHSMGLCPDSSMNFPSGYYKGFTLHIDLEDLCGNPPELLREAVSGERLPKSLHPDHGIATYPKCPQMDPVFTGFYEYPAGLQIPYFKLKAQELLLWLCREEEQPCSQLTQYQAEQIAIVKQIHAQLTDHLDQRITIEDLAKQYLMNPTTLKAVFKTVYGNSLAAHIKEHRMEKAAGLLRSTDDSVSQIARQVGYGNQSKFTAAFKEIYQLLPTEYRRLHKTS